MFKTSSKEANLAPSLKQLQTLYHDATAAPSSESYRKVWEATRSLDNDVREHVQSKSATDVHPIIHKLRDKKMPKLSSNEMTLARLWVVGDIEHYTMLENNVDDWNEELERLMGEIRKVSSPNPSTTDAFHLGALLRDATNVTRNIREYLDCKERVERFDESAKNPTLESRLALASIIEGRLESDMF